MTEELEPGGGKAEAVWFVTEVPKVHEPVGIDIRPHDCAPEDGFLPSAARIRDERVLTDTYYLMSTGNPTSVAMPGDTSDPTSVRSVIEAILEVNPEATIVLDIVYNRTLVGAGSQAAQCEHHERMRDVMPNSGSATYHVRAPACRGSLGAVSFVRITNPTRG